MIEFVGLCALAPLMMLMERLEGWRRLNPVEQNLQRASHGFALLCALAGGAYLFGLGSVLRTLPKLVGPDPVEAWPGVMFLGFIAYGLVRFIFGVRRCRGISDGILATRALVKLTVGLAVTYYVWNRFLFAHSAPLTNDFAVLAAFGVGLWYAITGAVRFVLMVGGSGGSAYGAVASHIAATNFQWGVPRQRRWWQFWKK